MPDANVVIVGGGAAGLTTAGALKKVGIESVILDKDEQVGGTWARRYERLHLHSVRRFSGLAHYPIPRQYPKYVPKNLFTQYLQLYARHFDLNIRLNCPVRKVRMNQNGEYPQWLIESDCGTWQSKVVVIATGHYGSPYLPDWEGMPEYQGRLIHSVEHRSGRDFKGKRVLVIGAGNSGTEIACDLAEGGATFIANSIRSFPPVAPRDWFGMPVQVFGMLLTPLPPKIADRIGYALAKVAVGDLSRYGVKPPAWYPFSAHRIPIIDVGWVRELKRGRIHIRPNIKRFTPTGVVYEDGTEELFDVVIAATGFQTKLAELIEPPGLVDERGYPKYRSGQPTPYPGCYFMGYTESVRGHLYEANRDSRRLAGMIAQHLQKVTQCETLSPVKAG